MQKIKLLNSLINSVAQASRTDASCQDFKKEAQCVKKILAELLGRAPTIAEIELATKEYWAGSC